jgi:hypothetical protein
MQRAYSKDDMPGAEVICRAYPLGTGVYYAIIVACGGNGTSEETAEFYIPYAATFSSRLRVAAMLL